MRINESGAKAQAEGKERLQKRPVELYDPSLDPDKPVFRAEAAQLEVKWVEPTSPQINVGGITFSPDPAE